MAQFDQTTERLAKECFCDARFSGRDEAEYAARGCPRCICDPESITLIRETTKPSLATLAQAIVYLDCKTIYRKPGESVGSHTEDCVRCATIATVKANGDWPLPSEKEEKWKSSPVAPDVVALLQEATEYGHEEDCSARESLNCDCRQLILLRALALALARNGIK